MADQDKQIPEPPSGFKPVPEDSKSAPGPPPGFKPVGTFSDQELRAPTEPEKVPAVLGGSPFGLPRDEPTRKTRAEAGGFDPEAEPVSVGARLGAKYGDAQKALAKEFDINPEDVDIGDVKGIGTVFKNPETGEFQLLDPAGADLGDLAEAAAEAPVIIGDVIGGLIGLRGGPAGVTAGAGAGGAAGGLFRDAVLDYMGITDPSAGDYAKAAAVEAAISAGGAAVPSGGRFARKFIDPKERALDALSKEGLTPDKLRAGKEATADIERESGAPLSAGQRVSEVDETLGGRLRATERQDPDRTGEFERQQAQARAQRDLSGRAAPDKRPSETEVGKGIQVEAGLQQEQRKDQVLQASVEESKRLQRELGKVAGMSEGAAGSRVRVALEEGRNRVFRKLSDEYQDLWSKVPEETRVDLRGLNATAREWNDKLKDDILPSLTPEDRQIVQEAMSAGTRERKGLVFDQEGVLRETTRLEEVGGTMESLSRTLSILKSHRRILDRRPELAPVKQKKVLNDFIDDLEQARTRALENVDKDTARKIIDMDHKWQQAKARIDEGLVGDILSKKSQERFRIADNKVIQAMTRNEAELRDYLSIASKHPELNAVDDLRKAMFGRYTKQVVQGGKKHETWMNDNRDVLKHLFSKKEIQKFEKAQGIQEAIEQNAKNETEILNELKDNFGYKLNRYDPLTVVRSAEGNPDRAREIKSVLKDSPVKWEAYKDVRAGRVVDKLETPEGGDSLAQLKNMLQGSSREELQESLGGEYVRNLERLQSLMRKQKEKGTKALTEPVAESADNVIGFMRRMIFGQLDKTSFRFKTLGRFTRESMNDSIREVLQDPEKLEKALRLRDASIRDRKYTNFLSSLGFTTLASLAKDDAQTQKGK